MLAVETKGLPGRRGFLKRGGYRQGFLPLDRGCFFIYAGLVASSLDPFLAREAICPRWCLSMPILS